MPPEVYTKEKEKRVSQAGAMAEPKTENLQLQAVASANKDLTPPTKAAGKAAKAANAFAPTLSALAKISDQVGGTYHNHKRELKHRVDIV